MMVEVCLIGAQKPSLGEELLGVSIDLPGKVGEFDGDWRVATL